MGKIFFLLLFSFALALADIIRVEPGGDDDCSDGVCSLSTALSLAEERGGEFIILLRPGTYNLSEPLEYIPALSGSLILRAEDPTNKPVLSGAGNTHLFYIYLGGEDTNSIVEIKDIIFEGGVFVGEVPAFLFIRTFRGDIKVTGCEFRNGAGDKGVELISDSGSIVFNNNVLSGGTYSSSFLSVKSVSGDVEIRINRVDLNSIPSSSEIIYIGVSGGNVYVSDNVVSNSGGRGIRIESLYGSLILRGNRVKNSSGTGFHISNKDGSVRAVNNLLYGNNGSLGGGMYMETETGTLILVNNTIYGNSSNKGGGAYIKLKGSDAILRIYNNILWSNSATDDGNDLYIDGVGSEISLFNNNLGVNADFSNPTSGDLVITDTSNYNNANNLKEDPLFGDPLAEDFSLQATSPLVDAGLSGDPEIPSEDIEGNKRVSPDIGAYEYVNTPFPYIHHETSEIYLGTILPGDSITYNLTVYNLGEGNLSFTNISTDNSSFSVSHSCSNLSKGEGCAVSITFSSATSGNYTGNLVIESNDTDKSPLLIPLTGVVDVIEPDINVSNINSLSTFIGGEVRSSVTIANVGKENLRITDIRIDGDSLGEFQILYEKVSGKMCGYPPIILSPGETCQIFIVFSPKAEKVQLFDFVIESNDPDENPYIVKISAEGYIDSSNPEKIEVIPVNYNFGSEKIGFPSKPAVFTVSNKGTYYLSIGLIVFEQGVNFKIIRDECSGKMLYFGETCNIWVVFEPSEGGVLDDVLYIPSSDPDNPIVRVNLMGVGDENPILSFDPPEVVFETKGSSTVKVTNNISSDIEIEGISTEDGKHFVISNSDCGKYLKSGETCSVVVEFKPTVSGYYEGNMIIRIKSPFNTDVRLKLKGTYGVEKPTVVKKVEKGCYTFGGPLIIFMLLATVILRRFKEIL